jgi:CMP-N-acetylneuraminic acid synthetase
VPEPRVRIAAVIPARGGSRRLPRKNLHPVAGRPMLFWSVEACRRSRHVDRVFVSTEDAEIAGVARACGARVIDRPARLAGDDVIKQEVIRHAARVMREELGLAPEIVLSVQPNSPEVDPQDLDRAIEVFHRFGRREIFSVDPDLMQNAAFRVLSIEAVFFESLSVHAGVFVTDYVDVHDLGDVRRVEERGRLQKRLALWEAEGWGVPGAGRADS